MSTTTKYSIKTLGVAGWVGSAVWDKVLKKLRLCSFRFNANGNFFKSRSNLESCFPELRSTFPLIAPVEVVHALHGQTTVSKAERRLWTFANNIFFQKSDWCFSFTLHLRSTLHMSPGNGWKWSNDVEKSEMDLFWCISMTNNVKSCKINQWKGPNFQT